MFDDELAVQLHSSHREIFQQRTVGNIPLFVERKVIVLFLLLMIVINKILKNSIKNFLCNFIQNLMDFSKTHDVYPDICSITKSKYTVCGDICSDGVNIYDF